MSGRGQVAYVDDDPRLRSLMTEELLDEGVKPLICCTGQELLDLLEIEQVDLIFLDLMMPMMDGLTCLQQLKERSLNIPVLIVTAFNDEDKRQESLAKGTKDYILKPNMFERLSLLLDEYLGKNRNRIAQHQ